jgi:hypothetical protein
MKIWKKILIINLLITLAIMSFFTCTALPYLSGVTENVEYQKYQKPLPLCCAIAEEYIVVKYARAGEPLKFIVRIGVPINESDLGYSGEGWIDYVEVYGTATNNSYTLLANCSREEVDRISCWGDYDYNRSCYLSLYQGYGFEVYIHYENKTECPLLLMNPHNTTDDSIIYDVDVYAAGYYTKIIRTYHNITRYDILISHLGHGLLYSAIAFVVIWILVFLVWAIAYHIISFIKWLKR